jgi:signal transduction histidine kinase
MWSKLSLRAKLTIFTILMLTLIAVGTTGLSVLNAGRIFISPRDIDTTIEEGYIQSFLISASLIEERDVIQIAEDALASGELQRIASASQRNFQNVSLLIVIAFVIVGAIGAFLISGQTIKPIKVLAEKMEDIDVNNLSTIVEPPKANDEISRLTNSFNNMIGKIDRSFEIQKLFAQNAAHELRTPLTTLRASVEILELDDEPTPDDYKDVVSIVKTSTDRMIELVQDLLSLNSVTDEMQWQTFSANDIFESIISELSESISDKGLTAQISGICYIKGDKTLLERAFFNLVHNAIRYNIDNGELKITLAENSIIIEDSGVGIPSEHLSHIFEPFYCVDKSRSKKLGGHGLGMTIAKGILDKHKIIMQIISEVGKGTKIILSK